MATISRNKTALKLMNRLTNPVLFRSTRLIETLAVEDVKPKKPETLAFEEIKPKKPYNHTGIVLHGLLGSGRNWRSFSRILTSLLSITSHYTVDWRMVLADLRNHGNSAELKELVAPHDIPNAANDLANLVKAEGWSWPDVVIGHSLGGKVALQYAQSCARGDYGDSVKLPKQLWVLDSVPGTVKPEFSDGEVEKVLKTLQGLPSPVPSREWLVDHMMTLGFSKSLSDWIGSSLKKSEEGETWAFNLEGAVEMFNSYRKMDYWPLLEHPPEGMEIVIVRAENSDRWDPEVVQRLENLANRKVDAAGGKVSLHVLPNSGHWVHVDNPKGLLEFVIPKISSVDNPNPNPNSSPEE